MSNATAAAMRKICGSGEAPGGTIKRRSNKKNKPFQFSRYIFRVLNQIHPSVSLLLLLILVFGFLVFSFFCCFLFFQLSLTKKAMKGNFLPALHSSTEPFSIKIQFFCSHGRLHAGCFQSARIGSSRTGQSIRKVDLELRRIPNGDQVAPP